MTLFKADLEELEKQVRQLESENSTLRMSLEAAKVDQYTRNLNQVHETLKTIWGEAPGMVFRAIPDNRHRMIWVGGDCLPLTGYTAAELTQNQSFAYINLVLPQYRQQVVDALQECITHKQPFSIVYPIQTRDGKIRYVRQGGWPDQSESPNAVEGFVGDITSCSLAKETNLAFHQDFKYLSEAMCRFVNLDTESDVLEFLAGELERIAQGLIIGLFLYDSTRQVLKLFRVIGMEHSQLEEIIDTPLETAQIKITEEELRQYSKAAGFEPISMELYEITRGLFSEEKAVEIKNRLNTQSTYSTLLEHREKIYGAAVLMVNDEKATNRLEILRTLMNILPVAMQRQQDARQLRENAFTFDSFLEQSKDGILLVNDKGIVQVWSRGQEMITGYTRDEIIGKPVWEAHRIIAPDDMASDEMFNNYLEDYKQQPDPAIRSTWDKHLREFTIQHKNGDIIHIQSVFFPVQSTHGTMIGSISRNITREKRHQHEMELIISLNKALRSAATRNQVLDVVIKELKSLVEVKGAAFSTFNSASQENIIEHTWGFWEEQLGSVTPMNREITEILIQKGESFTIHRSDGCSCAELSDFPIPAKVNALAVIPLNAEDEILGAIWIASDHAFQADDISILNILTDLAANALHRATMHEEQQRRLQHITALRTIDQTITTSLDVKSNLQILLEQVMNQLHMDAAAVLLFNPVMQTFDYAAGRGFRTQLINQSSIRLGYGQPGRAAMEQQMIFLPDLRKSDGRFTRMNLANAEAFTAYFAVPLVAKSEIKGLLELYHRSRVTPDLEWLSFLENLSGQAAILIDNAQLYSDLQHSNMELKLAYTNTLEGWVRAMDLRDQETEGHTKRVAEMTLRLASYMGIPNERLIHIYRGSLLHDIGKMAVPDSILRKPGPLNAEELKIMRQHPVYAYELLHPISYLEPSLDIPYCHHERWDGTGYPRGLKGTDIPLPARVFSVVDVWDALRSDRPYRKAWSEEQVLKYIHLQSGKDFDPQVVDAFLELVNG